MTPFNLRSLLLAAVVLSNCITWTTSRHHYTHNVSGHRSRHRRQGAGLYLSASYVLPGGEGTGWGEWGKVSPCSRTCGGGVASQKRICLEIGPDGQPLCSGGDTKYYSCQTQDCPAGSKDFREEQCSEFDNVAFREIKYKWIPYYTKALNPCELNCMPHGERFYYRHRTKVIDGTRCNEESFDVCVNGTCQPVGCDMMLGSSAREDKCRECRGNGANCHTTSGVLDTQDKLKGYNDMLLIPEGATSIVIEERASSSNYLALRAKNGTYYLNGDYHIDFPRSLTIAGALWTYDRSQQGFAAPDKLRCLGPTNEQLYLALLLVDVNVGISYEYSVPHDKAPPRNKRYNWVHEEFTPCSATCGGGIQTRNVSCRSREELEVVEDTLCDREIRPPTEQTCNTNECDPKWALGPWGECSKRCGEGGTRSREVLCKQIIANGQSSIVDNKKCFDLLGQHPELYQKCNENATCPQWFTGPWKPCDKLCDEGKQTRQVVCYQKNGRRIEVLGDDACEEGKPAEEQPCLLQYCVGVDWVLSDWSGCDTCLSTVRTRTASCVTEKGELVNDSFCENHALPKKMLEQPCDKAELPSCDSQWYATQWTKCSVDCGKGIQTRFVFCGLFNGESVLKVDDSSCAGQTKYNTTKECEIPNDKCPAQLFTGPWSRCYPECGDGNRFRTVLCLKGGKPAIDSCQDKFLNTNETCNAGPCDEDGDPIDDDTLAPVDYEDEDCEDEEESKEFYREEGLDAVDTTIFDSSTTMLSDSPTDWSTTWTGEQESTFDTEPTLVSEGFMSTISTSDNTETDLTEADADSTNTLITSEASGYGSTTELSSSEDSTEEGSGDPASSSTAISSAPDATNTGTDITDYASTESEDATTESETYDSDYTSEETGSTAVTEETSNSSETESDSSGSTENTSDGTTEPEPTDDTKTPNGSSTTEIYGTTEPTITSEIDTTGSEPSSEPGDKSSTEMEGTTESGSTDSSQEPTTTPESTNGTDVTETGTTEATDSTSSGTTEDTESTETTDFSSTDTTEPTETDSTEATETTESSSTVSSETTETGSTQVSGSSIIDGTETTEPIDISATEVPETGSTEVSGTSVSDNTEPIEHSTTEVSETGNTEVSGTSVSDSTEPTETTEIGQTEATEITESSTTEAPDTGTTEATETSDSGTTEQAETTEAGSTTAVETTDAGSTTASEPTEAGTTEGSETTEAETTEVTETTESGNTEATDTTEIGSTQPTELDSDSTESTVTEETTTAGSSETTEGTESSSESSTTEAAASSTGSTRWDLTSTVLVYTTQKSRVCKRKPPCLRSKFGCCPDKMTRALGPFDEACPKPHNCSESYFGCCPDGLSPRQGPGNAGCPTEPCEETLFGCCESDNKTPAEGNDQEGCPPPPPACLSSKYGCCKDGETEATGPEKEGCPETTSTTTVTEGTEGTESTDETETTATTSPTETTDEVCTGSDYGCCFDNKTAATGPELQGCPCETSEFKCCPDGVNPAQGPDFEGCEKSCNTSVHGCCPDGKTPAHGVDYEGCCLLYAFGCCPDNYKPADGPHQEGCGCQYSPHGCCPDNATVATGPQYEGCGCQYTQHGCCPDRHSKASGPEFEGCMCHTYQFGCCPDGVTVARGPRGQGCYCQQTTYGCCGDEQTPAKGNNKEGCDCATSKYGCCPDGITEATGLKFQNCPDAPENRQAVCNLKFERGECHNYSVAWYYDTEYGGCSRFWYGGCDGNGNRFSSKEDCEATCSNPPPKDACKLPPIKGACVGYQERWYYDDERNTCSNFIYGGCLGNNNNFETRELCQSQCEPEKSLDQCNLAIERGSCAGNYPRWGYSRETRRCEEFTWGGCEGNSNRFHTEAACMLRCNPPGKPQPECSEPQVVGTCNDTEALWSFSQSENRCVPFYFTGCGGNGNKFQSKENCQESCPSPYVPELCTLPAETGNCDDYKAKWYFDTNDQRCRLFYFGGCGGNANKFDEEQECEARCSLPPTTTAAPTATSPHAQPDPTDLCFLEIDAGPCNQWEPKWAYDIKRGKCVAFQFGGCGGNQNHFENEELCTRYCKPIQDLCQLPMLSGPCDASVMSWFYDASSDSCSQFTYGGCEGNDNRFESREECENRCKTGPAPAPTTLSTTTVQVGDNLPSECMISPVLENCDQRNVGEVWYYNQEANACAPHNNLETGNECRTTGVFYSQEACERFCGVFRNIDVCSYDMEVGPCQDFNPKYHYNGTSRRCEEFAYGGCLGGPNRFSSEQECEQTCMTTVDPCTLPPEPGNCINRIIMWYYDEPRDQCNQFAYGGCGGNENKFENRELCEAQCSKRPAPAITTTTLIPVQTTRQPEEPVDECRVPVSLEPCGSNITAFYYDERTSSCMAADIGNCGYRNSYRSQEECERQCGAFRGKDVCRTQLDPGPCKASILKFYFDAASGSCNQFTYGGCQGSANRFSTSEECQEVCGAAGPARACLQEVSTGEGCAAVPERRWHYDVARADCLVFAFQGCGGNENNFYSFDECAYYCRVTSPETEESRICRQYADECAALMTTCSASNFRTMRAPEGCKRCACEQRVSCDQQRRECDALRCSYGTKRTTDNVGCEKCKCFEDPCLRINCTSDERCVQSAYRAPVTQEVQYSAHCVREIETNEVLECQAYIDECSRISCPYGVQKTRTASGCERCVCVREEVDCEPLRAECEGLKCSYGLERTRGDDGCERCKCLPHPCYGKACTSGERCVATRFRDPISGESAYSAECRSVSKPGDCPAAGGGGGGGGGSGGGACRVECSDDADCRGVLRCCTRGCAQLCLEPAPRTTPPPFTTHRPEAPQAPQASEETEPQVAAAEGGKATLRCLFHGNPPPKITWQFGELIIESDVDRYRVLSDGALEIVSLYRNDSGVYICVASNELGSARQQVTLQVNDPVRVPAGIAGDVGAVVTGELDRPLTVRCLAYGYPRPSINWYRDKSMVPFSNALYEARGYDLLIRHLTLEALGEYVCHVYNGEGRAATWQVTVQAYQPYGVIIPDNPYLVPRDGRLVEVTPRAQTPDTTITSTTTPEPDLLSFSVPVQTKLLPASTMIPAGAQLSLPCEVDGFPEPRVHWTKDNVVLAPTDRMSITGSRLSIARALVGDSGVYACHAANGYSSHTSSVMITVQEVYVPVKCIDNPTFANCALIVNGKFCGHPYYSKFCCKSCVEAGQLDARQAEMQSDEPYKKK